jgi:ubiquitin-conjugating enzyme E2 L3
MSLKRLNKEYTDILTTGNNYQISFNEDSMYTWTGVVQGKYKIELVLPASYPFKPPSVRLLTPYTGAHPNINGDKVCLNIVQGWTPKCQITDIFDELVIILSAP